MSMQQAKEETRAHVERVTGLRADVVHARDCGRWAYLYRADGSHAKTLLAGTWEELRAAADLYAERNGVAK